MTVLVTGSTGLAGCALIHRLAQFVSHPVRTASRAVDIDPLPGVEHQTIPPLGLHAGFSPMLRGVWRRGASGRPRTRHAGSRRRPT
jgi:uncharacterized protein YbjT (DUF2867 family)